MFIITHSNTLWLVGNLSRFVVLAHLGNQISTHHVVSSDIVPLITDRRYSHENQTNAPLTKKGCSIHGWSSTHTNNPLKGCADTPSYFDFDINFASGLVLRCIGIFAVGQPNTRPNWITIKQHALMIMVRPVRFQPWQNLLHVVIHAPMNY